MGFIDTMTAEGHAVESICRVLREQGAQIAARTYRSSNEQDGSLLGWEPFAESWDGPLEGRVPDRGSRPRPRRKAHLRG